MICCAFNTDKKVTPAEVSDALLREKNRLQVELASSKDTLASKQSHINSILSELAKARQKHDALVRRFMAQNGKITEAYCATQNVHYQKLIKNGQTAGNSSAASTPLPSPSLPADQEVTQSVNASGDATSPELLPTPDQGDGVMENPVTSFDENDRLATDTSSELDHSATSTPLLGSPLISFDEGAKVEEVAQTDSFESSENTSSLPLLDLDFGPPSSDSLSLLVFSLKFCFTC